MVEMVKDLVCRNGENPVSKEGVKCLLILEGKRGL